MQPFSSVRTLTGVSDVMAAAVPADRLLADRVRRDGDEEAFRTLYRRHTPGLYRFVLRLLGGNEFDAEDIVQQAWLKAVEGLGDFRWEASFRTWLHGIALNCCRGLFRRKEPRWLALEEGPLLAGPMTNPDERMDLETALKRLPSGYRTVIVLHDVEGYTHEEIGHQLGISANTSKSQLSRGRRVLRSLLAPGEEHEARV
jgi:RNA polymerase sigma-70 factor (ECF subfamily)